MEQIVSITTQSGIGHAANSLLVQKAIDPLRLPTGLLNHTKRTEGVAQAVLSCYAEALKEASCNRW